MGKANIGRFLFAAMYLLAAVFNMYLALNTPEVYRGVADTALIPLYRQFMELLTPALLQAVEILFATYQIIIAFLIVDKGIYAKLGLLGGIIFHLGILPWGWWSLPNLLFIVPLIVLTHRDYELSIWEAYHKKYTACL